MYGHCLYLHFLDRFNVLYSLRYENGQGSFIYTFHNMTNIFVRPFVEPNWTLCDQYRINSHFYSIFITQRVRTKLESDRFSFQFNFPAKMCRNWVGIGQLRSSYPLVIYFSIFTEKYNFPFMIYLSLLDCSTLRTLRVGVLKVIAFPAPADRSESLTKAFI